MILLVMAISKIMVGAAFGGLRLRTIIVVVSIYWLLLFLLFMNYSLSTSKNITFSS
jgi:hypothetical protein